MLNLEEVGGCPEHPPTEWGLQTTQLHVTRDSSLLSPNQGGRGAGPPASEIPHGSLLLRTRPALGTTRGALFGVR